MQLKKITEFFNQRVFIVPNYQRGYSWKNENVYELLKDIHHAIQLNKDHYMGTITLHNIRSEESIGLNAYNIYHVVDGQQRFTTLIIILKVLAERLAKISEYEGDIKLKTEKYFKKNDAFLFRYEVDQINNDYFRSAILNLEKSSSDDKNAYTVNLKNAKKRVIEYFEDKDDDYCALFLRCIEDRLKFNEYLVESASEIGIVFETINNRGVALSTLELVKNRLLYLSSKIDTDVFEAENERDRLVDLINTKWSHILANLTLSDRVLDEDTFVTNFWIIYYGYDRNTNAKANILNERLTVEAMLDSPEKIKSDIKKFIESLAVASRFWRYLNEPLDQESFSEIDNVELRNRLKSKIVKLNRLNTATVRPLLLAMSHIMDRNPDEMLKLTDLCELFSYRVYEMNYRRADVGQTNLFNRAKELYKKKTKSSIDNVFNSIKSLTVDYGTWSKFKAEIEDLFASDKKSGYYNWKGLLYFLFEYEESKRNNRDKKIKYEELTKKKSIEHIYPQNPDDDYWLSRFQFDSKKTEKRIKHSLGNLLILDSATNSKAGRLPYVSDGEKLNKRQIYSIGNYSANELASNFKNWTPEKVKKREKDLLKFIRERWEFDVLNQENFYTEYETEELD